MEAHGSSLPPHAARWAAVSYPTCLISLALTCRDYPREISTCRQPMLLRFGVIERAIVMAPIQPERHTIECPKPLR